jgi:single-strand DNA-binding protein
MAGNLNKVMLIGNVGKDPEIRSTQEGKEIASFPLATSESWRDRNTGEKREKTEWHRVVIFPEGLVQVIKNYVKKGSKVYLEGSLQTRKWEDNNGQERYTTEIVLQGYTSTMVLLDRSGGGSGNYDSDNSSRNNNDAPSFQLDQIDDDIPF